MKRFYVIVAALLISFSGLRAKDSANNSLGLYLGYGKLKKQDLIFSPFVHQDWSPVHVEFVDGVNYEGTGMPPHVFMRNTEEEILNGQDRVLEEALIRIQSGNSGLE